MNDIIVTSIIVYIVVSLLFYSIVLRIKLRKTEIELKQSKIEIDGLSKYIKDNLETESSVEAQAKEDFLTFLSQSRTWAYEYIEEVQGAIENFKNTAGNVITYWEEYGDIISTPHDENIKRVISSYHELMKVLPEGEIK